MSASQPPAGAPVRIRIRILPCLVAAHDESASPRPWAGRDRGAELRVPSRVPSCGQAKRHGCHSPVTHPYMRPGALAALLLALQALGPAAQLLSPVAPPSLTLLLNANDALCLLVGPDLPAAQFIVLAVLRRVLEDVLYFWAGRHHGSGTLARLGMPPLQQAVSVPLLALLPTAPLHVAAGAAGMPPAVFLTVDTAACAVRVATLRWAGATRWAASLHNAALACVVAATIAQLARMLLASHASH